MPVHVLHIGKTGGSAVKAALRPLAEDYDILLREHAATLEDVPAGEGVVFFLRDPVERFVSAFNSRLRRGRPLYDSPWREGEAQAFAVFPTPNALAESLSSPEATLRGRACNAMQDINHLNRHYSYWLGNSGYIESRRADIRFVGRTERLAEDFERLKQLLGLPPNVSLPTDPVEAHVTPQGFASELSPTGRKNIAQWYADDAAIMAHLRL